jgi:cytosine/adenosine deaminase-related metal-dependent hydrolase
MTKFEVTDEMVKEAQMAIDTMLSHGSDMGFTADDVMRAAISAALQAMEHTQ